jgi:hypothetical protein
LRRFERSLAESHAVFVDRVTLFVKGGDGGQGNEARGTMKGKSGCKFFTSLSSAVTSSQPSRSARAT